MTTAIERAEMLLERQLRLADLAAQRIAFLESLPEEPTTDDPDGALVLWFELAFSSNPTRSTIWYTYAAVRAGNGLWYTTGPRSPKGFTWDELTEWMYSEHKSVRNLYMATEWSELN